MLMTEITIPLSTKWDHKKALTDLIQNQNRVFIDLRYAGSKHDDGYCGVAMYIPNEDRGYTIIEIAEDGFVYEGDTYPAGGDIDNLGKAIYQISPVEAIQIMLSYRNLRKSTESFENILVHNPSIRHDCVYTVIASGYEEYKRMMRE